MNPNTTSDDLCIAYLSGELDDVACNAFEQQLAIDPSLAETLLRYSRAWLCVASALPDAADLPVSVTAKPQHSFQLISLIAIAVAASLALLIFVIAGNSEADEETLLAQAWADQSTADTAFEPLGFTSAELVESFDSQEQESEPDDYSEDGDSFEWMLVAITDQLNSEEDRDLDGGATDES